MITLGCANSKSFENVKVQTPEDTTAYTQIDHLLVRPYGLFNMDDKVKGIEYEVVIGNVVWSIIGVETVFIPVICLGWYLWEPVSIDKIGGMKVIK